MEPSRSLVGVLARGSAVRVAAHVGGTLLVALSAVVLLRSLGARQYGDYATAGALLGIAAGVGDAGLTQAGQRRWGADRDDASRSRLLAGLLGLRLVLLPASVVALALAAALTGRGSTVVLAVLLAGVGVVLHGAAATLTVPVLGALRYARAACVDLARQAALAAALVVLAAAGAGVPLVFLAHVVGGAAALALAVVLVPAVLRVRPSLVGAGALLRETLPLAGAVVVRAVLVAVPVLAAAGVVGREAAGLVGASQRVVDAAAAVLTVAVGTLLPVLVAGEEHDRQAGLAARVPPLLAAAVLLGGTAAVALVVLAEPVVRLLGGDEYAAAAPVLRVHAVLLALVPLTEVAVLALVSERRLRGLLAAHLAGLVVALGVTAAAATVAGARAGVAGVVAGEAVLVAVCLFVLGHRRPALAAAVRGAGPAVVRAGAAVLAGAATALALPGPPGLRALGATAVVAVAALALGAFPVTLLRRRRSG